MQVVARTCKLIIIKFNMSNIPARILVLQPIGDVIAITWVIRPVGQAASLSVCSHAGPSGSLKAGSDALFTIASMTVGYINFNNATY